MKLVNNNNNILNLSPTDNNKSKNKHTSLPFLKALLLLSSLLVITAPLAGAASKSAFQSLKAKSENTYKLLILGDNGQVNFFFQRQFTDKTNNKTIVQEWYNKNLLAEQYNFKKFQCLVKTKNKIFNLQKNKQGLQNFDKIISNEKFKLILAEADGLVFLGDIIYPETKFLLWATNAEKTVFELPYKDQWRRRLECAWNLFFRSIEKIGLVKLVGKKPLIDAKIEILAGNHSFDVDVEKEEEILLRFGNFKSGSKSKIKKFQKRSVLLSEEDEVAKKAGFVCVPGTAKKIGKVDRIKKLRVNESADSNNDSFWKESEQEADSFVENLDANSDIDNNNNNVENKIENSSFISLAEAAAEKINMQTKYSLKNHNSNKSSSNYLNLKEVKSLSDSKSKKAQQATEPRTLTKYPKFIEISFDTFAVQFIDFNSGAIICITEETEENYLKCNKFNASYLSFAQAKRYFKRLYTGISKRFSASSDKKTIWKALRAHHPPVNSEDGDSDFYFKEIKFSENPKKIYNLISLMKSKRISIFFGSHIHNAQVILFPYGRKYKQRTANCKEKPSGFGCFEAPSAQLNSQSVFKEKCSENFKFELAINEKENEEKSMLYIFINGNSGRTFDALKSGKLSNGMVVWSRAVISEGDNQHYGFSTASFTKDKVAIDFYELNPVKNEIAKVSEFNLVKGDFPKFDVVDEVIESVFCKN